ncbi:MAG: DUF4625 domain-containing protein [Tannerellaceae bacterium]|nr:DUF4625 domain-containing protein [Tannerellaceae bacterium]
MKTKRFFSLWLALCVLSIPVFAGTENQQEDKTKPTINLMEPQDGAIVKIGDRGAYILI